MRATLARDRLLERYSSGGLNPTWITLNWGVSQGSAESRVALIEAIEDAAAAAVVADVADPEVVDALSLDADRVTGLAAGHASDGSFERVLAAPAAEYRDGWPRWVAVGMGALLLGTFAFTLAAFLVGAGAGFVAFVAVALAVVLAARRRTPPVADADATRVP